MSYEGIEQILEVPEQGKSSPVQTSEAVFMYEWIRKHGLRRTLEVGLGYGRSAAYIMRATGSSHIAMDPFQSRYNDLGLKNADRLGHLPLLDFRPDRSHNVLPQLLRENRRFDFIFIDGDHKYDAILLDFYYSDLLLERGGYVMLHDMWMRSTRLVVSFIRRNKRNYRYVKTPLRNLALFQKQGEDTRSWTFFREFYTVRSVFSHPILAWLHTGQQTPLKRFLLGLNERLSHVASSIERGRTRGNQHHSTSPSTPRDS